MATSRRFVRFWMATSLLAAVEAVAHAQSPGDLDLTFNGTGKVLSSFGGWAGAVRVDDDDQIVVAGYTRDPLGRVGYVDQDALVARYNQFGHLDIGFGGETTILGTAVTSFANSFSDVSRAIAIDGAGRIVAAGWTRQEEINLSNENFGVARYTAWGAPNVTFDAKGWTLVGFLSWESYREGANAVAVDSEGRTVVAGYSIQTHGFFGTRVYTDFALARLDEYGSLDPSFGGDGKVLIAFDGAAFVNDIAIDDQGRIVAVGMVGDWDVDPNQVGIVRLLENGSLDTSFGNGGKVLHSLGRHTSAATAVVIDPAGQIVVGGVAADYIDPDGWFFFPDDWERPVPGNPADYNDTADFAVARFLANGSLDTRFGTGGVTFADFAGYDDIGNGLAIDQDGRILQVGATSVPRRFAIARYTSAGLLDPAFGIAGKTTTEFGTGTQDVAMDVAIDSSNRVVVAGFSRPLGTNDPKIAMARYENGAGTIGVTAALVANLTTSGAIDSEGVSRALTSTLAAAQASIDSRRIDAALNQLTGFIRLVKAQDGKHIDVSTTLDGIKIVPGALLIDHARSLMDLVQSL